MSSKGKQTAAAQRAGAARRPGAGTNDSLFRSQFRKSELCRFFRTGRGGCWKGKSCDFAHGSDELRAMPDLTKTSLCRKWLSFACPLDSESCPFAHGEEELRSTQAYADRFACDSGSSRGADSRLVSPSHSAIAGADRRPPPISTSNVPAQGRSGNTAASEAPASPMLVGFLLMPNYPINAPEATHRQGNAGVPMMPPCTPVPGMYSSKPVLAEALRSPYASASSDHRLALADSTCARLVAEAVANLRGPMGEGVEVLLQQALPEVYED